MIGDPEIIFLDEPSAGMDPEARRFMWNVIAEIAQTRKQATVVWALNKGVKVIFFEILLLTLTNIGTNCGKLLKNWQHVDEFDIERCRICRFLAQIWQTSGKSHEIKKIR